MSPKLIISISLCCFFCTISSTLIANRKLTENYISKYKIIAVSEMKRTGIPASIKLAQGILESDLGRSPLAYQANNHFGIKCGKDWTGDTFFKLDDDTDSTGTIIESCFRAFVSGDESYLAHSEFLANPSKQSRYGFLFELSTTDYVGWANGLKFAGYASDPSYPSKLIRIIENNQLYIYDEPLHIVKRESAMFIENIPKTKSQPEIVKEVEVKKHQSSREYAIVTHKSESKSFNRPIGKYAPSKINDIKMVKAFGGESIKELALRNKKNIFDLLEYNENIRSQDHILGPDDIVFLEKKKKSVEDESLAFHTVSKGENLYLIAQKYGIRLESLKAKNNIPADAEPIQGELLSLSRNLSLNDSPKYKMVERFDNFVDFGGLQ